MKTEIITFIIMCLLAYLLGCFISASFNITEWSESIRASTGVFGVIFAFIGIGIANDKKQ